MTLKIGVKVMRASYFKAACIFVVTGALNIVGHRKEYAYVAWSVVVLVGLPASLRIEGLYRWRCLGKVGGTLMHAKNGCPRMRKCREQ